MLTSFRRKRAKGGENEGQAPSTLLRLNESEMLGPATPLSPKKGLGSLWQPPGVEGVCLAAPMDSSLQMSGLEVFTSAQASTPFAFLQGPWPGAKALPIPPRWKTGRV